MPPPGPPPLPAAPSLAPAAPAPGRAAGRGRDGPVPPAVTLPATLKELAERTREAAVAAARAAAAGDEEEAEAEGWSVGDGRGVPRDDFCDELREIWPRDAGQAPG
jgi:hypothetical protein